MSTGMSSVSYAAGGPNGKAVHGDANALALRDKMAGTTSRIIVKYRPKAGAGIGASSAGAAIAIDAMATEMSQYAGIKVTHFGPGGGNGAHIFKLEQELPLEEVDRVIEKLSADPTVEYVEPDRRVFAFYTPNDPQYKDQWHYYDDTAGIRLPAAWDTTKGEGVIVAVVDTGYTEHPDLLPNLQLPGYDMIGDTASSNDGDGRDADAHDPGDYSPNCGMNESTWHGTHTSGTVAAVGDNGVGVVGVAFKAKVLPVRVLGKCGGLLSDFADGIVYAAGGTVSGVPVNKTPAKVISLSLGGDSQTCSRTMQNAINTARQLGATIVVAAGNSSKDVSGTEPANCDGVIVVAATDKEGKRSSFSNYGSKVDIAAPGEYVLSTLNAGKTTLGAYNYEQYKGTSMSTPHVSGVAALLYSIKPTITPDEVKRILKDTARPAPGSCSGCGAGLLDAAAAVAAVSGGSPTPTPTPNPNPNPNPVDDWQRWMDQQPWGRRPNPNPGNDWQQWLEQQPWFRRW
jgi:serine protease